MQKQVELLISEEAVEKMGELASKQFPLETGGLLIGYQNHKLRLTVVTDIIGPGSKAKHHRYSFTPDYDYQEYRLSEVYKHSGRTLTYLGDWHSHPLGSHTLSSHDSDTLQSIADFPKARMPFPFMTILAGSHNNWIIKFWQLRYRKFVGISIGKQIQELSHKFY